MRSLVLFLAVIMRSSATDCSPGELVVTGGGVVRRGDNISLTLCLDQGETCEKYGSSLGIETF